MTYILDYSDTGLVPNRLEVEINTINNETPLNFVGRNYQGYGEIIAENFLHLLENFASADAPESGDLTTGPTIGQFWFDKTTTPGVMKFFDDGAWHEMVSTSSSSTDVTFNDVTVDGDLFVDNITGTGSPSTFDGDWNTSGTWIFNGNPATDYVQFVVNQYTGDGSTNPASACVYTNCISTFDSAGTPGPGTGVGDIQGDWNIDGSWTLETGATLQATYADIAERYHADEVLDYGTVVRLGGINEITKTTESDDLEVFGVISHQPAYMMNAFAGTDETHPYVAMKGRTPVKVVGKVKKGQYLVSSEVPGVAMARDTKNVHMLAIVGRALVDKNTDSVEKIECTVGAN